MPALPIYLDNHSTTRVDPRVVEAMRPWFDEQYGNAGSSHAFGQAAREAVEAARATIARAIGAEPREIVFTSGATESNNLAIRGAAERVRRRGDHLVTVAAEHPSVLDPLARLTRRGMEVTILPVLPAGHEHAGCVEPERVAAALRDDTLLVSAMLASNEIGAIHPVREIAAACRARGVLLHCDATQALGRIPLAVDDLGADLASFSAHKLYGPKGVGALYVRQRERSVRLEPLLDGGGQEQALRSGTLNVPGIVGFARAVELAMAELPAEFVWQGALRDRLHQNLARDLPEIRLNGPALAALDRRLPNNLNLCFPGVQGEALMLQMPEIAVSSGSACASVKPTPSHVLLALGLSEDDARASLRIGLGRFTTEAEIDYATGRIAESVRKLRKLA